MISCKRIVYSLQILAAITVAWGFSGYFSPAGAHETGAYATDNDALNSVRHDESSKKAPAARDTGSQHCNGAGPMCHLSTVMFWGYSQLAPRTDILSVGRPRARRTGRAIVPPYRPPIYGHNAVS